MRHAARLATTGLALILVTCEGVAEKPDFEPVPHPLIGQLEATVAETIGRARARLETVRGQDEPPAKDLAAAFGRLGMAYQVHDFQRAAGACYRNALHLQPDEPRWMYYLAHVHLANGALEKAVERLQQVLHARPGYAPARVHLADTYALLNRPEDAAVLYREALNSDGTRAAADFGLGRIELRNGDFAAAARHFEAALERQPHATKIHYPLARAYRGMGREDDAKTHLEQRVERGAAPTMDDPMLAELRYQASGARIHLRRGDRAVRAGQLEQAREAYRKAVSADPRNPQARYNLGVALAKTGREGEATHHLSAAARLEPGSARNALALAWNLDQLERDQDALSYYRMAIDRGENDSSVHRLLGDVLMRLDRPEEALRHYRTARELAPGEALPAFREAVALVRTGRYAEASERFAAATQAHPDLAPIRNGLARVLATGPPGVRDPERALAIAQKLFREHRTVPFAHTYAMALAASGRFDQAVNAQRSTIKRAQQVGMNDKLPFLQANLDRFVSEKAADRAWPSDAQVFHPDTMTASRKPHDDPQ